MTQFVADAFYQAFRHKDPDRMAACYSDTATFSDPVFPKRDTREVRGMWRMLLSRSPNMTVDYRILEQSEQHARVAWTANYEFSQTGRPVTNEVVATLAIRDNLIQSHRDDFDFWRWSRQALGLKGLLLGWTPIVRNKVQAYGREGLDAFLARNRVV